MTHEKPVIIEYEKSTGRHFHIKDNKRTEITNLPPQASLIAVKKRAIAMGLKVRKTNGPN